MCNRCVTVLSTVYTGFGKEKTEAQADHSSCTLHVESSHVVFAQAHITYGSYGHTLPP